MNWKDKIASLKKAVTSEKKNVVVSKAAVCIHNEVGVCGRCALDSLGNEEGKTAVYESLESNDIRRVIRYVTPQVRESLKKLPGKVILAGGLIRAIVGGEAVHDIDLFLDPSNKTDEACPDSWLNIRERRDKHYQIGDVQLIWRYNFRDATELLESFDYTIAKAAIWFDEKQGFQGICHERFYRDVARKMLVWDCDRDYERIEAIPRLIKFVRYGYHIEPEQLAQTVVRTCLSLDLDNGFEGMKKQLQNVYVEGGTDKEWTEMNKPIPPKPKPQPQPRVHDYSWGS